MSEKRFEETTYDGSYYQEIGDFQRELYGKMGFVQGTVQEVDFLADLLRLPDGARILDVGCGTGRHSLEFARRGFHPVGIDISSGLIDVAREIAATEHLDAAFHVGDARALDFAGEFDAAICLCQGAFGIAGDEAGHRQILAGVSRALRPGAPFVLTAINAVSAIRSQDPAASFDPYTLTSSWTETFRSPAGETQDMVVHCTAFTYRELKWLLEDAGLKVQAAYGCVAGGFERKSLTRDDIEIMMVAGKA